MGESHGAESESYNAAFGDVEWIQIPSLGVCVTPMTAKEAAFMAAGAPGKRLLLNHNMHSAFLIDADAEFQALYSQADWVVVDGTPILWLASLHARKRLPSSDRISSTDWIDALPQVRESGRLFVYGATPSSNVAAVTRLSRSLEGWTVSGVDGFVDEGVAIKCINEFQPDLVIVGLGMPRQEHFLLRNLAQLPVARYATVGGAIDYFAGATRLAPRWLGRFGVEWLWRLANEPRRLAYRYLIEPILLSRRVLTRSLRSRRT